jgi:hypothetical protein
LKVWVLLSEKGLLKSIQGVHPMLNWKRKIATLLESEPLKARTYFFAQEKIEALSPVFNHLPENTNPQAILTASVEIESMMVKEGISLKELLEKKYQEVQKVLPVMAPKIKNVLMNEVTDVDGLQKNLQNVTDTITRNEEHDASEFKYTRKNTNSFALSNMAKSVVNNAAALYRDMIEEMPDKKERVRLFLSLLEDEVVKILDELEPALRGIFNVRVKEFAKQVVMEPTFSASKNVRASLKKKAINDMLLENCSGSVKGEAEITEIRETRPRFLVTSPKSPRKWPKKVKRNEFKEDPIE